ncbi:MAG: hypothetical protein KC646_16800 [Candidatus Cloacimonetes bacterium]|nr:hypothetical protein [Candidatus Cloacimonadota bacterium]
MIDEEIRLHNKSQIEFKYNYSFPNSQKKNSYQVDTYIFIPSSLGMNHYSYPSEQFYRDLQSNIRLKTPSYSLEDLTKENSTPFTNLLKEVKKLKSGLSQDEMHLLEDNLKMFCSVFRTSIRDHLTVIKSSCSNKKCETLVDLFLESIVTIIARYRSLRVYFEEENISDDALSVYKFGDEYLSLLMESVCFRLIDLVEGCSVNASAQQMSTLYDILNQEKDHRLAENYGSVPVSNEDNEEYIYRRSVLKKFASSVLYLNTKYVKEGKVLEQVLYSIAAGIAMIFATVMAFYFQVLYGNLTFPFLVTLVISYMLKDRMKDSLKLLFVKKFLGSKFDHKFKIFSSSGKSIGFCKESCRFLKVEYIPQDIMKYRNRERFTEIEDGFFLTENIIHHQKLIQLNVSGLKKSFPNFKAEGITDITRFTILKFLEKMDGGREIINLVHENQREKIRAKKVYHINLVIRYSSSSGESIRKFRVVLDKKGIKRIEEPLVS